MAATTYEQVPETKHINCVVGDDVSIPVDFDIDLSGYTLLCSIGGQTPTLTPVDLSAGKFNIILTKIQTTAIGVNKVHWYLGWTIGGLERTVLAGNADFIAR